MLLEKRQASIGKLRTRGMFSDDPAMRLGLSSMLDCVDFRPRSLPPNAILIVKQLSDPLPGKLSLPVNQVYLDSEWESAAQDQLELCYQQALRPQQGFIPTDAEAIVFSDQSELLACWSYDFASGTASQHWWWDMLLTNESLAGNSSQILLTHLLEDLIYLPAVLDKLQSWYQVKKVLQIFMPDDCRGLSSQLAQQYGLSRLAEVLQDKSRHFITINLAEKDHALHSIHKEKKEHSLQQFQKQILTLYKQWVGETTWLPEELSKEQTFLLVLGLTLQRAPWLARRKQFQQDAMNVWLAEPALNTNRISKPPDIITTSNATNRTENTGSPNSDKTSARSEMDINTGAGVANNELLKTDEDISTSNNKKKTSKRGKAIKIKSEFNNSITNLEQTNKTALENSTSIIKENKNINPATLEAKNDLKIVEDNNYANEFITTEIGGFLYLINLMKWLDLPGCFEKDWHLESQLGPWALLELLGRALLDDDESLYRNDFIWPLLTELDGRQVGELPGASFIGHDEYRLPIDWFNQVHIDHETFFWSSAKGRLRLWAASGYMLVDVPRSNISPKQQATIELQKYVAEKDEPLLSKSSFAVAPISNCTFFEEFNLNIDLRRFLSYIMPYIQFRLLLSLDVNDQNESKTILYCRGNIYFSSSHIDFVTPLDNINLKLRRAGLDCDPGWLPDYGRVVHFHFD